MTLSEVFLQQDKDTFLWEALDDLDGYALRDFLMRRDGACIYSARELDTWLHNHEQPGKLQKLCA
jgi:hypothetical protein